MNLRWSIEGRPVLGFCGGSKDESRFHITSVSRVRIVTQPQMRSRQPFTSFGDRT